MLRLLLSIFFLFIAQVVLAQSVIRGRVVNATDRTPLPAANVVLRAVADSSKVYGTTTGPQGGFQLEAAPGRYRFQVRFIGFDTFDTTFTLGENPVFIRGIALRESRRNLKEVQIEGVQQRVEQKGDTTSMNADAYKVNRDASAEQLVTKMPGITVENGTIKAQGEDVRRVLVDGQEFFGEDATLALRNLPAEVVDRVQVFDQLSEQARFTGFNDGNTEKTINIVTKAGKNNGLFGRVFAGYGTDERYQSGGNVNIFKGQRRITLLAQSNNINQQNFSSQDLLGLNAGASGGGGRFGGGRMGGGRPGGGGGSSQNFLVGQQAGINQTHSIGLNYTDKWGEKIRVSGSYFFNGSRNTTDSYLSRQFFESDGNGPLYTENNSTVATNFNHRFNLRLEYQLDSANSFVFTPRLSLQTNVRDQLLDGLNRDAASTLLSSTYTDQRSDATALNGGADLLWRHKLRKEGRTWSVNMSYSGNERESESELLSLNNRGLVNETVGFNQRGNSTSLSNTYSLNLRYTEPIGKSGQLELGYEPRLNLQNSDQQTLAYDSSVAAYSRVDSQLSNRFDNEQFTQRFSFSYRLRGTRWSGGVGLNYQLTDMRSRQLFPLSLEVNRNFRNFLPNAMLSYSIDRKMSWRLFYRTSTNLPSLSQLQNVVDNSNPLQISTGNPNLVQEYSHFLVSRYNYTFTKRGSNFSAFVMGGLTEDYLGSSTFIAAKDTVISGIPLQRGARLTNPVNLSGAWNLRSNLTYGFPVKPLKSNLNLTAGLNYNEVPGLVNGQNNRSGTTTASLGAVLGSNISPEIDFTLSYNFSANRVTNSLEPALNSNFSSQLAGLRANWQPTRKWMISSEWAYTRFTGLDAGIDPDFLLWNAGIGYRLGPDGNGEIRISAFDILGQNQAIGRTVSDVYVEDNRTTVLQRYFLLTLTWNLRKFGFFNSDQAPGRPGVQP